VKITHAQPLHRRTDGSYVPRPLLGPAEAEVEAEVLALDLDVVSLRPIDELPPPELRTVDFAQRRTLTRLYTHHMTILQAEPYVCRDYLVRLDEHHVGLVPPDSDDVD
jgi:hypothetical protein